MALKFFPETILLLKVDHFEGILYWIKIDRIVNDHSSSYNSLGFKIICTNIIKNCLQFLATLTSTITLMLWP